MIPPGFERRYLNIQLGQIAYITATGHPWAEAESNRDASSNTLVFLHGFGGGSSSYEWSKVYPAFVPNYRILAPDLLGWGESEHLTRGLTIDNYVSTILRFIERTCDRPATVLASSLTAGFTVKAAIQQPSLFHALILSNPTGLSDFGQSVTNELFANIVSIPILNQIFYEGAVANSFGIRSFLEQRQFADPARIYPEIVEAYLTSATKPNASYSALSFVKGDLRFDLALDLPNLTTPTAILWGEKAQFTSLETGQRLAQLNATAIRAFQTIPDVGLTPALELPGVTIGLIGRFLNQLQA